jgi:hypothetical protein
MPTVTEIRAAIAAKMNTVADIGRVHDYERWAKRDKDFQDLFLSAGQIRGWIVRRTATRETSPGIGRFVVTHRWQIRGYMALDDSAASEKTFDALVEALRDAFRSDETLGGLVASTVLPDGEGGEAGLQLEDHGPVMFANVLCHGARLRLATVHFQ